MFSFLKNHPFAVEAFFKSSVVLTFAVPIKELRKLVPARLELDTLNDQWGFIAVAMVQTKDLRPMGFPKFLGNDFFLLGYRVFVRYTTAGGKRLRGLYILRSETNKKKMEIFGNVFTHYNYSTTDISHAHLGRTEVMSSVRSGFRLEFQHVSNSAVSLPDESPFKNWNEARKFAGPLPFTFSVNDNTNRVLIIEGVRENWKPIPLHVLKYEFSFLENLNIAGLRFSNAFIIENVPYYWKKGKIDQ